MNSKQLHKHSLPIIVLSVGIFIASTALVSQIMLTTSSGSTLLRLLSERRVSIRPAANGLVHVSRYQPGEQADSSLSLTSSSPNSSLGVVSSSGQTATLDAALAPLR